MKRFEEHKRVLTLEEAVAKYCPNAKSIEEYCKGDEVKIQAICKAMDCDRHELLISAEEAKILAEHSPRSKVNRECIKGAMDCLLDYHEEWKKRNK